MEYFKMVALRAYSAVDRMFDEEERMVYETRMQSLADVESKIASAEEKGKEKGLRQGIEQGVSLATKNIALNLAKAGTPLSVIALATGLSETILNQLLNN